MRIQKRKLRRNSLREKYLFEVEALNKLLENIPVGIILIDKQQRIKDVNNPILTAFPQLKYEDLVDKHVSILGQYTDLVKEQSPIIQALKGKENNSFFFYTSNKKILFTTYPIKYLKTGEILGAVGIGQDITEQEVLKTEIERLDRLNLVGKMAASLAHEIRNPLTAVRGFTQMLMAKADEESRKNFAVILEELDRTNNTIENFLSLSRNKFIEKTECSLNEIIEDVFLLLENECIKRDIYIRLELEENLPSLFLNPRQIKQLILNLGFNALDAMNCHGKLTIGTKYQQNNLIQLIVSDTGHGISKEHLGKLFEPFYTSKENGTGLGLSVCWSIIQQHGAKIKVQSQEGQGTIFIVIFDPKQKDLQAMNQKAF